MCGQLLEDTELYRDGESFCSTACLDRYYNEERRLCREINYHRCAFCNRSLTPEGLIEIDGGVTCQEGLRFDGDYFCDQKCLGSFQEELQIKALAEESAKEYKCKKSLVHHPISCKIGLIMHKVMMAKPEDFPIHIQVGEDGFKLKNAQDANFFFLGMMAMASGMEREFDQEFDEDRDFETA
jgi:hypothetical protein